MHRTGIIIAVLFFLSLTTFAGKKGGEYSKRIFKEYSVNEDVNFSIKNKYGKVHITTWNENKITIEVNISLSESSQERANKKLDRINVSFSDSPQLISAVTKIESKGKFKNLDIDYTIKMPVGAELNLENQFGDVYINEIKGETDIYVAYGTLDLGFLRDKHNKIVVKYGKIWLKEAKYLDCKLRYTEGKIKKVQWLKMDSQYSEYKIDGVGLMELTSAYDEVEVRALAKFTGSSRFSEVDIFRATQKLKIKSAYGDYRIKNIDKSFTQIDISGAYTDYKMSFDSGASFQFSGEAAYADIDLPNNSNVTKQSSYTTESYKGTIGGDSNPSAIVKVSSSYGDIDIEFED